ncbi:MAG: AAA family ATPase [Saprospiraceae bacterium]|jgi:ATP-dependent Clp protease ATP-binding subunit ClpA|nr:AAA family ATPase [Saprospiraceae bacterium]
MPNTLTLPFYTIQLSLTSGGNISMPLLDTNTIRINQSIAILAGKYANSFQEKVLDQGEYHKILDEYKSGNFEKSILKISIPSSKDKIGFPDFEIEFEYFTNRTEDGFWGVIPAIGIEGFAKSLEELLEQLKESTRLEFARKKRFQVLQQIIQTMWFGSAEMHKESITFKVYTPSELLNIESTENDELLPKIGLKLKVSKQATFGRFAILDYLIKAVKSSFNQNVLLIGPAGVGKTSLVWELARISKKHQIKEQIWETTASVLIKELTKDTGWQDNIVYLCKELREKKDFLFIRNFAELFEVGKYVGNEISVAEYLRSFIQRGDIKVITEITHEELAQIELKSPGYLALFQHIRLAPPPLAELQQIILEKINTIAQDRKISLKVDAIQEVIRLNKRFTPYAGFPGKPIRFLESLLVNLSNNKQQKSLSKQDVINHFCSETGMPPFLVSPEIPMDLKSIKKYFNNKVYGQEKAVDEVSNILGTVKTALTRTGKPIASFLFVGPTGVGKTELAKVLAEFTFGDRNRMIRFDMSEYANSWSVARLTGTSYYSDGLLTAAVRRNPFCVLLFDEIEKASPTFYDLLLQILSEGRLTDSRGKLVNFCSTIIIMTSNIGATEMQSGRIGWKKEIDTQEVSASYKTAVEKYFRPELYNRIDQVIPFKPLTNANVRFVVEREIELFRKREGIQFRNMDLKIEDSVLDYLADEGYDPKYGARQLQRTIREKLIIPLSKELNLQDFSDRLICHLKIKNKAINIEVEADPLGFDLLLEQWDMVSNADQASELRRNIIKLKEGAMIVRFFNKFDHLENIKKRQKEQFWKNQAQAESYSHFLQIIDTIQNLTKKIEGFEMEISLACMDMGKYDPNFEEHLKDWNNSFFNLKKQLYSHLNPESNNCYFMIYGTQFEEILAFYLKLFEATGYTATGKAVWFSDSYYNEEIMRQELDDESKKMVSVKRQRKEYIYTPWVNGQKKAMTPPNSGDILYGIELKVTGDCPYLFLKDEEGFQSWTLDSETFQKYFIRVTNIEVETPLTIHRRNFYQINQARRTVETNRLIDTKLKMNRELSISSFFDVLVEILVEQFRSKIETEVV